MAEAGSNRAAILARLPVRADEDPFVVGIPMYGSTEVSIQVCEGGGYRTEKGVRYPYCQGTVATYAQVVHGTRGGYGNRVYLFIVEKVGNRYVVNPRSGDAQPTETPEQPIRAVRGVSFFPGCAV